MNFKCINDLRKRRYEKLVKLFHPFYITLKPISYSFFILKLEHREAFRTYMSKKNIYLPVHWPAKSLKNELSECLISVPLFDYLSDSEFNYMVKSMQEYFSL